MKEHEKDVPTSQQKQEKDAWISCENEDRFRQGCNQKTTGEGEKKPYSINPALERLLLREFP